MLISVSLYLLFTSAHLQLDPFSPSLGFRCPTPSMRQRVKTGSHWTVFTFTTTGPRRLCSMPARSTLLPLHPTTASTSAACTNMTRCQCPAPTLTHLLTGTSLLLISRYTAFVVHNTLPLMSACCLLFHCFSPVFPHVHMRLYVCQLFPFVSGLFSQQSFSHLVCLQPIQQSVNLSVHYLFRHLLGCRNLSICPVSVSGKPNMS